MTLILLFALLAQGRNGSSITRYRKCRRLSCDRFNYRTFFEAVSEDGAQLASSRGGRYGAKRFLVASVIAIGCSLRNPWTLSPRGPELWRGSSRYRTRECTIVHERTRTTPVSIRGRHPFVWPRLGHKAPRLFCLNKFMRVSSSRSNEKRRASVSLTRQSPLIPLMR